MRWVVNATLLPPVALPPGKRPGTHCIGGRVGPRACLNGFGKSRPPTGIRSLDWPTRSESVYRLRHAGLWRRSGINKQIYSVNSWKCNNLLTLPQGKIRCLQNSIWERSTWFETQILLIFKIFLTLIRGVFVYYVWGLIRIWKTYIDRLPHEGTLVKNLKVWFVGVLWILMRHIIWTYIKLTHGESILTWGILANPLSFEG
jgi:hypothetical protein